MADKAQAEPTMEEILASIRKIIADDGDTSPSSSRPGPQTAPSVDVSVSEDDNFDDLSLDDVTQDNEPSPSAFAEAPPVDDAGGLSDFDLMSDEDASGNLLADVDDDMFDDLSANPSTSGRANVLATDTPAEDELEDFDFGSLEPAGEEPRYERSNVAPMFEENASDWAAGSSSFDEPVTEASSEDLSAPDDLADEMTGIAPQPEPDLAYTPEPEPALQAEAEPEPEPVVPAMDETELAPAMTDTPSYAATEAPQSPQPQAAASSGLTDERIAGVAASALGKLMVRKTEDEGDANTLDGLMRELLRPMIKDWLDANLPSIVERKVEEEVQRIARMAR
jgi:cell pole-organizing protein PopZ